jgi:hypothetical protein
MFNNISKQEAKRIAGYVLSAFGILAVVSLERDRAA